ncbi:MAG TPA: hypothetical protein V6C50_00500, partial [Crinalium sp.]
MPEEESKPTSEAAPQADSNAEIVPAETAAVDSVGTISKWLTQNGFEHESLGADASGVEMLKVEPEFLIPFST